MNKNKGYVDQLYEELMRQESFDNTGVNALEMGAGAMAAVNPDVMNRIPGFKAEFDLTVKIVINESGAGSLPAVKLPLPIFGYNDYQGNFREAIAGYNLPADVSYYGSNVWPDVPPALPTIPNTNGIEVGDLIHWFKYDDGSSLGQFGVIINCQQVAYGSLLYATASDKFILNLIRYSLPDETNLQQYSESIEILRQSLFGRRVEDTFNPKSFKLPNQQQKDIIDMPLTIPVDKQHTLFTEVTTVASPGTGVTVPAYEQFSWNIFVQMAKTTAVK